MAYQLWHGPGANSKTPPQWDPGRDPSYGFHEWRRDVLWNFATEVQETQKPPPAVFGLGGLARELAREVDPVDLRNSNTFDTRDGQDAVWHSGLDLLLYGLSKKFAALEVEGSITPWPP